MKYQTTTPLSTYAIWQKSWEQPTRLITMSTVRLEKLTVTQKIKFPAICGTKLFILVFQEPSTIPCPEFWASLIQSRPSHLI
jgi:hypothetical protein